MSKCKHNRLPDRIRGGSLPRTDDQYFCTQCTLWVPAELVNREVDRRIKEDAERMAQLREELKDGGKK
jgi:hypothetical protein